MGYLILWILAACLCAIPGSNKNMGYGGALLLCILLSPVIGLIILLILPNAPVKYKYTCKFCKLESDQNSHYCPRCGKDLDGYTLPENQARFATSK